MAKNIENEEFLNSNFKIARKFVEKHLELNLTLIELVELKKIVGLTTKQFLDDEKNYGSVKDLKYYYSQINPDYEAGLIFMNKNYGTQIYNLEDNINFEEFKFKTELGRGFNYCSYFFKKMQSEMHFP